PWNVLYYDRLTKNSSVQNIADGSVRALPHLLQAKFFYPRFIRSNSSAFDPYAVLLDGISRIDSHLVICGISVLDAKIIIFYVGIYVGQYQFILNEFPNDPCHFISV